MGSFGRSVDELHFRLGSTSGERDSTIFLIFTMKNMTIREVKKALRITDADIAKWFGYTNRDSYYNSVRRERIEKAIVTIYEATVAGIKKMLDSKTQ